MERRLGMRAPAARRKLLAWWQGSRLPGICDATGVRQQNDFSTLHTRGSESSPVTKVRPYLLLTSGGAHQRAGSRQEEEERNAELHPVQMLNAKVFSGSCAKAQA